MLHSALLAAALVLGPATSASDSLRERSVVQWTPESFRAMSTLYQSVTHVAGGVEFAACLQAERRGNAWIVTDVVVPPQSGNSRAGIESADCTGYEGTAHSHPLWEEGRDCLPSFADRSTFAASANEFLVVWCDVEAFTYRTKDLGVGGKDDRIRVPGVYTSAEPFLWKESPRGPT